MKKFKIFLLATIVLAPINSSAILPPANPPAMSPFGDGKWWVLTQPLKYRIGISNEIIIVPRGFVTDLTSVPRFFWAMFPSTGKYMSAAILHDYLYYDQRCGKESADEIFDIEMKAFGVQEKEREIIYLAVKEFGDKSWKQNSESNRSGEIRVIPERDLDKFLSEPFTTEQSWSEVKKGIDPELLTSESGFIYVKPVENPDIRSTCSRAITANR